MWNFRLGFLLSALSARSELRLGFCCVAAPAAASFRPDPMETQGPPKDPPSTPAIDAFNQILAGFP